MTAAQQQTEQRNEVVRKGDGGSRDWSESFFLHSTLDSYEVKELSAKQFASIVHRDRRRAGVA